MIGREARRQMLVGPVVSPMLRWGASARAPRPIGLFHPLLDDPIELIGVEAGGPLPELGHSAATIGRGTPGVLHGSFSFPLAG